MVSVYYKYGEYGIDEYDSEQSAAKAIIEQISSSDEDEEETKKISPSKSELSGYPFEKLCSRAVEIGKYVINGSWGYGIVGVFRGSMILESPASKDGRD